MLYLCAGVCVRSEGTLEHHYAILVQCERDGLHWLQSETESYSTYTFQTERCGGASQTFNVAPPSVFSTLALPSPAKVFSSCSESRYTVLQWSTYGVWEVVAMTAVVYIQCLGGGGNDCSGLHTVFGRWWQ